MVSMLTLSVEVCGFQLWSGQTKDYIIGICSFSAKQRLAWYEDNVSEWSNMSISRLLFQWASNIKILTKHVDLVQKQTSFYKKILWKICFFYQFVLHITSILNKTIQYLDLKFCFVLKIKFDFVDFIRMFLIFMVSGGVTIQAILYPNYPLGTELLKRVLTRPLFAMFLTQIGDLDG